MSKMKKSYAAVAALLTTCLPASAAISIIAQYDMSTSRAVAGNQSTSADVAANVNVTAGGFTENLTSGAASGEFGVTGSGLVPAGANGLSSRSLNTSPTNPWWEFTVTPQSGVGVKLATITLDAGAATTLAGSFRWDYDVYWSGDSFASKLGTFTGPTATGTAGTPSTLTGLSVDLSSLAEQTAAFTIRIAPNRVTGTNGATSQRAGWIDNVTLNADVTVVPEPSAVLLGSLGLAGFFRRRR